MDAHSSPDADNTEVSLLNRLRSGDEAAFSELVRCHSPRLLAVARRLLRQEEDAHDALQDAFISAFKGLADFDGKSQLGTWLHRITVNAALMKLRAKQRKPEQPIDPLLPKFLADGHRQNPGPAWGLTAAEAVEKAETCELVRRCIDQLPDSYRLVLVLRDIEQLDTGAVAQHLGIEAGAVKTRLHRARQALRTLLDPHFPGRRAMTCLEFIEFLMDYADNSMSANQHARFDEHLAICPDCVNYLASYRTAVVMGKSVFNDLEQPLPADVPEELIQAILSVRRQPG